MREPWVSRLACVVLTLAGLAGCSDGGPPLELRGPAMGTTYGVIVTRLPRGAREEDVRAAIEAVLVSADQHLSGWNASSEVTIFNAQRTIDWQPVSPVLFDVLAQARAAHEASGGTFDVTVAPLVQAWGFGPHAGEQPHAPSVEERQRLLARTGFARLELRSEPPGLRKSVPDLEVDLDGIAPGWAVDRIAERLEALRIHDYLVELGGEVRASGLSPGGRTWRVAVETPLTGERRPQAVIELRNAGVSTSGDYREFRELDGRRISHTIDPRTGEPVAHGLTAVTVVARSAADADAWATALMVLGREQGLPLARQLGLAVLFIERGARPGTFVESQTAQFEQLRRADRPRL